MKRRSLIHMVAGVVIASAAVALVVIFWPEVSSLCGCRKKEAVILAVNDIYRIEGLGQGSRGGLARLRTLRAELERDHPDLLVLHAGDIIAPSLLSRRFRGQQMIDVLNQLDGLPDRGAFDDRLFAVFGNHEFDYDDGTSCQNPTVLRDRVGESEFTWVSANIDWADCNDAKAMLPPFQNLKRHAIVTAGGIRIGIFGLTLQFEADKAKSRPKLDDDIVGVARKQTAELRAEGAEVVIALTHEEARADQDMLAELKSDGPDLVIGGHEHTRMAVAPTGMDPAKPRVFKADSDATTANVITITLGGSRPEIRSEVRELDESIPKDPMIQRAVDRWIVRYAVEFCSDRGESSDCLDKEIGRTLAPIEGEELENRGRETGIGDWIADRMRERADDADVGILNSGNLRLNDRLPAGASLHLRQLEELIEYDSDLVAFDVPGSVLWNVVQHSLEKRGAGGWAHMSGIAAALDDKGKLARLLVRVGGRVREITVASTETIRVVTSRYLACGGDDYAFQPDGSKTCPTAMTTLHVKLKELVFDAIQTDYAPGKVDKGIEPTLDHRICEAAEAKADCLITQWARKLS